MRQLLSCAQNEVLTRRASAVKLRRDASVLFEPVSCRTLAGHEVAHGELARIADIDGPGEGVIGCHQADQRLDQVVDIAEAAVCMPSP